MANPGSKFNFAGLLKSKEEKEAEEADNYYKDIKFQDVYQLCFERLHPKYTEDVRNMEACFRMYASSSKVCESALAACVRDQKNKGPG